MTPYRAKAITDGEPRQATPVGRRARDVRVARVAAAVPVAQGSAEEGHTGRADRLGGGRADQSGGADARRKIGARHDARARADDRARVSEPQGDVLELRRRAEVVAP